MEKLPLINSIDAQYAKEVLEEFYQDKKIPAEKKTYIANHFNSRGAYLGIETKDGSTHYLLDAASQIATLGLGFNPSVLFGTSQFRESWNNDPKGDEFTALRKSHKNFLQRKLNWDHLELTYCHSGAEANEIALGDCFANRVNKEANKILAFEGSFHGRMMVSLQATWNKSKREPFAIPGYEAIFNSYPEIQRDEIIQDIPDTWCEFWDNSCSSVFEVPTEWSLDVEINHEITCLVEIRKKLLKEDIFAILIEPMQCEGGDRYSTNRFHTALLLMAKSFGIPVIYDEVQTGYHLGNDFFWHRQFLLQDQHGNDLRPEYVVCAKKAQVGMVLSQQKIKHQEEFQVASAIRGYLHGMALDQANTPINTINNILKKRLTKLCMDFKLHIERPRTMGLCFAFDLKNESLVSEFIRTRFDFGLLYYPAGQNTLRFRLNLAWGKEEIDFLFDQLEKQSAMIFKQEQIEYVDEAPVSKPKADSLYHWHQLLIDAKSDDYSPEDLLNRANSLFKKETGLTPVKVNIQNFKHYEPEISRIQKEVYEPQRQTSIDKFRTCAEADDGLSFVLEENNRVCGMIFSAPLYLFPFERALRRDPSFEEDGIIYVVDTTIMPDKRNQNIGRLLKYYLTILAICDDNMGIHGRNRDQLASSMLAINLSLGSYELFHVAEDYLDDEAHRDLIYYRTPLRDSIQKLSLSDATWNFATVDANKDQNDIPIIVNKVCLSNFVSRNFLNDVMSIQQQIPQNLRHTYTTSGQSECVDKIAKSIKFFEKTRNKMLTFDGHFFGSGSFMSRSLSYSEDQYFNVEQLPCPTTNEPDDVLKNLETIFNQEKILAVWLEPILQRTMRVVPQEFLKELKQLCLKHKVFLIYNETASQMFRYSDDHYFVSNIDEICPSASFTYLGGQAGICFLSEIIYLEKPLMMISTWDGDEFAFRSYVKRMIEILNDKDEYLETITKFDTKLHHELKNYPGELTLKKGIGNYKGQLPAFLKNKFIKFEGRYIINPSYKSMVQYND